MHIAGKGQKKVEVMAKKSLSNIKNEIMLFCKFAKEEQMDRINPRQPDSAENRPPHHRKADIAP